MRKFVGLIPLVVLTLQLNAASGGGGGGGGCGGFGMPYTTLDFNHKDWGSYYTISYAGEQYFAGYACGAIALNQLTFNATSNSGQLHSILMNDDIPRILNPGESLSLGEGYRFQIKDIDITSKTALVTLLKGEQVDTTPIEQQKTYIYAKKAGNISELPIIAIYVSNVSNKVDINGVFQISEGFITITPTPTPTMEVTSWGNNYTKDQQLSISVIQGTTVRFNTTTNYDADSLTSDTDATDIPVVPCPVDAKNCQMVIRFDKAGTFFAKLQPNNNTFGSATRHWKIAVTQISTPTPALTTVTPTSTITMATSTITPYTPVPTTQIPFKKRAQLQVTYEVNPGKTRKELTITVSLKNTGNATASHITLAITNPPELEAAILSGSDKIGETILWKGELKPNEEHITKYSIKAVSNKNLEIPLKVTYAKVSPDEKAKALGILSDPANTEQLLTPEDWEVISLIIRIAATLPGFEIVTAIVTISAISVIYLFRRRG